jgi:hypothetical protein
LQGKSAQLLSTVLCSDYHFAIAHRAMNLIA